ncbi:hypothetical protein D3C87_1890030 [compost metagenome]
MAEVPATVAEQAVIRRTTTITTAAPPVAAAAQAAAAVWDGMAMRIYRGPNEKIERSCYEAALFFCL